MEYTSHRGENYQERQRRRDVQIAGMHQGIVLLVPWGVLRAAACDGIFTKFPLTTIILIPHQVTTYVNHIV